ncbi:OmpA family protein [Shewanella waksmanii]|uniref:OmpA family protein n=1 Tax=Shewanella waksmanii TaxID=213783 RepID=UPI003736E77F
MRRHFLIAILLCYIPVTLAWQDSDGDGVPDIKDACPDTPRGAVVDAAGCQRPQVTEKLCLKTTQGGLFPKSCTQATPLFVQFAFAEAEIAMSQWAKIGQINEFLSEHNKHLSLLGFTDSIGESGFNLKLSEQRANNIKDVFITDFGYDPSVFTVKAMGSNDPIASNDTELGRSLNRRVEFVVNSN